MSYYSLVRRREGRGHNISTRVISRISIVAGVHMGAVVCLTSCMSMLAEGEGLAGHAFISWPILQSSSSHELPAGMDRLVQTTTMLGRLWMIARAAGMGLWLLVGTNATDGLSGQLWYYFPSRLRVLVQQLLVSIVMA